MKKKPIPKFKNETEERAFWEVHDSAEHVDWSKAAQVALPNRKRSVRTISLRLPEIMQENLKMLANKRDVPCQSLLKLYLSERIEEELNTHH